MNSSNKFVSRKKFLAFGVALSPFMPLPFFKFFQRKKATSSTVKMLTQDGKLVEIDVADIPAKKKKIKAEDIHTWLSKKHPRL